MKQLFLLILLLLVTPGCGGERSGALVVATPLGPLAYPLFALSASGGWKDVADSVEVVTWRTPDQLRAMVAGGQADIYALPTNTAALLANRGADLRLLAVALRRVLWIVSRDSTRTTVADFAGTEIVTPFRGDLPHIVLETVVRASGLDPERDLRLRYVATPLDAVQQLLIGRADHAVLAEPEASMAVLRSMDDDGLTPVVRAVDLEAAWNDRFDGGYGLPLGGIAVTGAVAADPRLTTAFLAAYRDAARWCCEHPDETAALVAERYPGVDAAPHAEAMRHILLEAVPAADARPDIEALLHVLLNTAPETLGGRLPDDAFYLAVPLPGASQ